VVVVVFTAGKKRGMRWNSTTGESPKQCRIKITSMGPGEPEKLRAPDPTGNLSFVFKTDSIRFIWLKLRSHVTVEFFSISHLLTVA